MISAEEFARGFSSLWRDATPMLSAFVRFANGNMQRFAKPVPTLSTPGRRSYLSEIAFRLVAAAVTRVPVRFSATKAVYDVIVKSARQSIALLEGVPEDHVHDPSGAERDESIALAKNLLEFLRRQHLRRGHSVVVDPEFAGCGLVERSWGDLFAHDTLHEVKSVDRAVRATDFQQLLTYAAMNSMRPSYEIQSLSVVNPRQGTFIKIDLEELCRGVSGAAAADVLGRITWAACGGEVSL